MRKDNTMLKKILPLFLTLTLVITMIGMDTLVAKASAEKAEGPVEILQVIDEKNTSVTEGQKEEANTVNVKVALKDADTKKIIKEDTSFAIYDKEDTDFEDLLAFVNLEEGKASEELELEAGKYVLQQFEEIDGYKEVKDKVFEVKKDQKKEINLTLMAKASSEPAPQSEAEEVKPEEENLETTVKARWIPEDTKEAFNVQLKDGEQVVAEATLQDGQEEEPLVYENGTEPILEIVNREMLESKYSIKEEGNLEEGYLLTLISSAKYTSIDVTVEGLEEDDFPVTIALKNGEKEITTTTVEDKEKTAFGASGLEDAYIYDQETGDKIQYEVTAPEKEGYEVPEVAGNVTDGFVVTYKAIAEPTEKAVKFNAEFEDEEGNAIEGFAGKIDIMVGDEIIQTVTLEEQDGVWSVETKVPFDVEYDIYPEDVEGYTIDFANEDENPDQWNLLYIKDAEEPEDPTTEDPTTEEPVVDNRISVPIKIVWKDTDPASKKVNVKLLHKGNNKVYKVVDVTSTNKWKANFAKVDPDGKYKLSYQVFDGYTAKVTGSLAKGFTITYTKNKSATTTSSTTTATTTATTASSTTATTAVTTAKNAKTGDDNHLMAYVIVLCVAAAGFVILRRRNRTR